MSENREKLILLENELGLLAERQKQLDTDIQNLRNLIEKATAIVEDEDERIVQTVEKEDVEIQYVAEVEPVDMTSSSQELYFTDSDLSIRMEEEKEIKSQKRPEFNLEKLIGENIISKIGIAILILGIAIGTKYAIDHDMISPLTRIILGYLSGLGLFGVAVKLKSKYEQYSAVLMSGAISIQYFVTYAAYDFYHLIPQSVTFCLMAIMTVFAVLAALSYNLQIIALFGLVGAYAVPFLLSDGSGHVEVLFTYMAIINSGILVIAYKKYWKLLNYVSFALTWLIYASWSMVSFDPNVHFTVASVFILLFFFIFYFTFLLYKLHKKELFTLVDIVLILSNSGIFYGLGYELVGEYALGQQMLGLFTLGNGMLHAAVSWIVFKQRLADKNLLYLLTGMVIVFVVIAVPVQLDGSQVTLIWMAMSALLFVIGRRQAVKVYEGLSYVLLSLAFLSLFEDWSRLATLVQTAGVVEVYPVFNSWFLTSLLMIVTFAFILKVDVIGKYPSVVISDFDQRLFRMFLSASLIVSIYISGYFEIDNLFNYLDAITAISIKGNVWVHNQSLDIQKLVWLINYSILFCSGLLYINYRKIHERVLWLTGSIVGSMLVFAFLIGGLTMLGSLNSYYDMVYFKPSFWTLSLRYFSFVIIGFWYYCMKLSIKSNEVDESSRRLFLLEFNVLLLWILSSELIHLLSVADQKDVFKLGISILWAVYALVAVVTGIVKKSKDLRVGGIALFALTLVKLFLYDLEHLSTLSKTVVLVALGLLLLIISFLYTKYRHLIFEEEDESRA